MLGKGETRKQKGGKGEWNCFYISESFAHTSKWRKGGSARGGEGGIGIADDWGAPTGMANIMVISTRCRWSVCCCSFPPCPPAWHRARARPFRYGAKRRPARFPLSLWSANPHCCPLQVAVPGWRLVALGKERMRGPQDSGGWSSRAVYQEMRRSSGTYRRCHRPCYCRHRPRPPNGDRGALQQSHEVIGGQVERRYHYRWSWTPSDL